MNEINLGLRDRPTERQFVGVPSNERPAILITPQERKIDRWNALLQYDDKAFKRKGQTGPQITMLVGNPGCGEAGAPAGKIVSKSSSTSLRL